MLAETPQYLRDKDMIKYNNIGSNAYGVNASGSINNYANGLIRDWFNSEIIETIETDNTQNQVTILRLYTLKCRALIEEAIQFNPEGNFDRIRALGMVMLFREEYRIRYGGNMNLINKSNDDSDYLGNDEFFRENFDNKFNISPLIK